MPVDNATIGQVPAVVLRPAFGWKTVDSFSPHEHERERPVFQPQQGG